MVSTTRSKETRDLRAMDLADPRIPVAWKLRNSKIANKKFRHSSSSPTSTSSNSSSDVETRSRRYSRMQQLYDYGHPYGTYDRARSGTIRSTRSMPGVTMGTTWDGRPCPVHGGSPHFHPPPPMGVRPPRRSGSMFELRASPVPSFFGTLPPPPGIYATLPMPPPVDVRSHYGSMRSIKSNKSSPAFMLPPSRPPSVIAVPVSGPQLPLPPLPPTGPMYQLPPLPPTYLLPPGARPRPLVIPAGAEPLPVRNPTKKPFSLPGKEVNEKKKNACCRGPMPFVWFVVILVSVGVILGIILGATLG